ncbi:hypothetical protein Ancab_029079 [Ancistrocladus abbreviatus]
MADHFAATFSLLETADPNLELINYFTTLNSIPQQHQTSSWNSSCHNNIHSYPNDTSPSSYQFPGKSSMNFPGKSHYQPKQTLSSSAHDDPILLSTETTPSRVRKSEDTTKSCPINLSPPHSHNRPRRKDNSGKLKREREEEKGKEVVHVRAKRGQATDSHSIAERIRREKINERLRCLQDIVPGCYKSMGMAVMLDETINYVHSLQNQVEFLSMKLAAASALQDLNTEINATETMQLLSFTNMQKAKAPGLQEVERSLLSGGFDQFEALASFHS